MSKLVTSFMNDESGATAIEYGLIAALIALTIMVGAGYLGNAINAEFARISDLVSSSELTSAYSGWAQVRPAGGLSVPDGPVFTLA